MKFISQNYKEKNVMKVALPVTVKFLQKENKELARNLASYLSLAANDYAQYLSPHVLIILESIISGNYGLCRALPEIYKVSPDHLSQNAPFLVALLSKCEMHEKEALLSLFDLIADSRPMVLENCIDRLCDCLTDSHSVAMTMDIILKMSEHRLLCINEHVEKVKTAAKLFPTTIAVVAKILSSIGLTKDRAQYALEFIYEEYPNAIDRATQKILRDEAKKLCQNYPVLFSDKYLAIMNPNAKQTLTKTSGGVTIVKLNSTDNPQNNVHYQGDNTVTSLVNNVNGEI